MAVKVKLPPLVIVGTDTVPIENFYQINITGTMNKKYCSGETKGERALALSIYNDINNFTYYTLPDKMIYTFANDMDAVEVSLQLEAILVNGTRYKSGTDYQIYRPESIRLDIYNFYHYVEFVVTNQSTGWSKVL